MAAGPSTHNVCRGSIDMAPFLSDRGLEMVDQQFPIGTRPQKTISLSMKTFWGSGIMPEPGQGAPDNTSVGKGGQGSPFKRDRAWSALAQRTEKLKYNMDGVLGGLEASAGSRWGSHARERAATSATSAQAAVDGLVAGDPFHSHRMSQEVVRKESEMARDTVPAPEPEISPFIPAGGSSSTGGQEPAGGGPRGIQRSSSSSAAPRFEDEEDSTLPPKKFYVSLVYIAVKNVEARKISVTLKHGRGHVGTKGGGAGGDEEPHHHPLVLKKYTSSCFKKVLADAASKEEETTTGGGRRGSGTGSRSRGHQHIKKSFVTKVFFCRDEHEGVGGARTATPHSRDHSKDSKGGENLPTPEELAVELPQRRRKFPATGGLGWEVDATLQLGNIQVHTKSERSVSSGAALVLSDTEFLLEQPKSSQHSLILNVPLLDNGTRRRIGRACVRVSTVILKKSVSLEFGSICPTLSGGGGAASTAPTGNLFDKSSGGAGASSFDPARALLSLRYKVPGTDHAGMNPGCSRNPRIVTTPPMGAGAFYFSSSHFFGERVYAAGFMPNHGLHGGGGGPALICPPADEMERNLFVQIWNEVGGGAPSGERKTACVGMAKIQLPYPTGDMSYAARARELTSGSDVATMQVRVVCASAYEDGRGSRTLDQVPFGGVSTGVDQVVSSKNKLLVPALLGGDEEGGSSSSGGTNSVFVKQRNQKLLSSAYRRLARRMALAGGLPLPSDGAPDASGSDAQLWTSSAVAGWLMRCGIPAQEAAVLMNDIVGGSGGGSGGGSSAGGSAGGETYIATEALDAWISEKRRQVLFFTKLSFASSTSAV